jgi:hypothetical protein
MFEGDEVRNGSCVAKRAGRQNRQEEGRDEGLEKIETFRVVPRS